MEIEGMYGIRPLFSSMLIYGKGLLPVRWQTITQVNAGMAQLILKEWISVKFASIFTESICQPIYKNTFLSICPRGIYYSEA